ncbi:MAG TPA: DUF2203 domain-containing protein [Nitrososphaeraceae archaeon]|nr:DUF2203 domain-containing protein [Nitrososphaeraceae archaeon]
MSIYFTPQDANRMLPEVKRLFSSIIIQKNKVIKLQEELQRMVNAGTKFTPFITKKQELNKAVFKLYETIAELENKGVMIKSVDEGLLDFPSLRFDEEVWLCWKEGENEIKFWHRKDEGFMGRKPLANTNVIDR